MKARHCPVEPDVCGDITGWDAFLRHVHDRHTSGTAEERQAAVQAILSGEAVYMSLIVPKVTADPRTAALWFLIGGATHRARQEIGKMGTTERRVYLAQLTELINMLWGELG